MKREKFKHLAILIFASAMALLSSCSANAQGMYSSSSGGWSTGFGTVYGSHGYAMATQDMYRVMQRQMNQNMIRDITGKSSGTKSTDSKAVAPPARVLRNHGVFRPDSTVDTGKAMADALGDTPEEKTLIRKIYTATKAEYEKEAAVRGWKNNIAAGLTFFTVTAAIVYHDAEEPSEDGVKAYFQVVTSSLDEMPEFAKLPNKDKQGFNNMLIGFSGILLSTYAEAKQTGDTEALATSKKLAAMLIEMVLKTDPENLRIESGQIVMK